MVKKPETIRKIEQNPEIKNFSEKNRIFDL